MILRLPMRAVKRGECRAHPYGRPVEMVEADYDEYELEVLRGLAAVEPGSPDYQAAANSAHVLHELKVLLPGGRLQEPSPALLERLSAAPRPVQAHPKPEHVQTSLIPPTGTTALKLPTVVRENLGMTEPQEESL